MARRVTEPASATTERIVLEKIRVSVTTPSRLPVDSTHDESESRSDRHAVRACATLGREARPGKDPLAGVAPRRLRSRGRRSRVVAQRARDPRHARGTDPLPPSAPRDPRVARSGGRAVAQRVRDARDGGPVRVAGRSAGRVRRTAAAPTGGVEAPPNTRKPPSPRASVKGAFVLMSPPWKEVVVRLYPPCAGRASTRPTVSFVLPWR